MTPATVFHYSNGLLYLFISCYQKDVMQEEHNTELILDGMRQQKWIKTGTKH